MIRALNILLAYFIYTVALVMCAYNKGFDAGEQTRFNFQSECPVAIMFPKEKEWWQCTAKCESNHQERVWMGWKVSRVGDDAVFDDAQFTYDDGEARK